MLNSSLANYLQFFTLPAEIIGITLAYIEFGMPATAAKYNKSLLHFIEADRRESIFKPSGFKNAWLKGLRQKDSTSRLPILQSRILMVSLFVLLALSYSILALLFIDILQGDAPPSGVAAFSSIAAVFFVSIFLCFSMALSKSKPLGGLSLGLASIGVFGEFYQTVSFVTDQADLLFYTLLAGSFTFVFMAAWLLYRNRA